MTTTDKTVSVPVSAIKALYEGADGVGAFGSTYHAVVALRALIPIPAKVGDVVHADNWRDLPVGTVLRDKVGDLWLVGPEKTLSYLNPRRAKPQTFDLTDPAWDEYTPIIISLPSD